MCSDWKKNKNALKIRPNNFNDTNVLADMWNLFPVWIVDTSHVLIFARIYASDLFWRKCYESFQYFNYVCFKDVTLNEIHPCYFFHQNQIRNNHSSSHLKTKKTVRTLRRLSLGVKFNISSSLKTIETWCNRVIRLLINWNGP